MKSNYDSHTVDGFGDEWSKFNFSDIDENEMRIIFDCYFKIFPWKLLSEDAVGLDMGSGSGRYAMSLFFAVKPNNRVNSDFRRSP